MDEEREKFVKEKGQKVIWLLKDLSLQEAVAMLEIIKIQLINIKTAVVSGIDTTWKAEELDSRKSERRRKKQ